MSDTPVVLRLTNVSKSYNTYTSNLQRFGRWFGLPFKPAHAFHAVDDVSFKLHRGEALGLIGQNGAGKSTLLKMITGTVRPSGGLIETNGTVSAILELGLGFNPEFTGRENIIHSGSLLGYDPAILQTLMPDIEAFAEIGEYFDEHVRTYSSGMLARLAFALATAVRPEILIVDEVLSVGDAYFQHKSFARIREFREQGTTIIIVTHSLGDVRELCDKVILLENGRNAKEGLPDEVLDYYNAMVAERENKKLNIEQRRRKDGWLHTEFGDGRARMVEMDLYEPGTDTQLSMVNTGAPVEVRCKIDILEDIDQLVIGHRMTDRTGHVVWGSNSWHHGAPLKNLKKGETISSVLSFPCVLGPGSYAIHFGLHRNDNHLEDCYHKAENQIVFEVMNTDKPYFLGTSFIEAELTLNREGEDA